MFDFSRQTAGVYIAEFRYGYSATVEKTSDGWLATIYDAENKVVSVTVNKLLAAAKINCYACASQVMVDRKNALSDKPVQVSITTPVSCDPSTETYFSM